MSDVVKGPNPDRDELSALAGNLEPDAVRTLSFLAKRLLVGQREYGCLDLSTDKRDWRKERGEELADLLVYSAFAELSKAIKPKTKLVIIESPYAGAIAQNEAYARACLRDSLERGEAPFASHLLYTQPGVLNDDIPDERTLGFKAGFAWGPVAEAVAFYIDLGWSRGMKYALEVAEKRDAHVRTRTLGAPWSDLAPSDAHLLKP